MPDNEWSPAEGAKRVIEEAYLSALDRGKDGLLDPSQTLAYLLTGLEYLTQVTDQRELFLAVSQIEELGEGRLRMLAAQAIIELRDSGWKFEPLDEEEGE